MLASMPSLSAVMDERERSVCAGIDSEPVRLQALASAILKRYLLSAYAHGNVRPRDWVFETGWEGKPVLSGRFSHLHLHFNVSHCDDLFVMAVQRQAPVGIDVEPLDAVIDDMTAQTLFTAEELRLMRQLAQPDQKPPRVRLWTLKEAYLKFLGVGLQKDPRDFDMSTLIGSDPNPAGSDSADSFLSTWTLQLLGSSYSLSVARFETSAVGSEEAIFCFATADELRAGAGHRVRLQRETMT